MPANSVRAFPQRGRTAALATAVALALLLGGCAATMSPQIYSPRLQEGKDAKSDPWARELPKVIAEVEQLQTRYVTAIRELSQVQPAVTLSLIGLSAFSLLKGIISPSTDAVATAAVLGSAAYVYGSTVISKPRQLVYLAGVEALSCAVAAVEPFNKSPAWLGDAVSPALDSLYGRIETATQSLDALRRQATLVHALDVTETIPAKSAAALPNCAPKDRPACDDISTSATADERRRLEAACRQEQTAFDRRCQPRQLARPKTIVPDPIVQAMLKQADDELVRLQRVLVSARRTASAVEQAGPLLWERAVQIQVKVGAEVLKTEPDLSSVLAAVQGLRGAAGLISGTDMFKTPTSKKPTGASQGKEDATARQLSAVDREELEKLRTAVATAAEARVKLALMVAGVDGQVAATRKNLALCEVKAPGVTLAVLPDDEEVRVASGGNAVFYVSGGSGTPQGAVVGVSGSAGNLARELDPSGRLRFTYTAPDGAAVGDTARIQFTDGSGQARHDVRVIVSDGAPVSTTTALSDMTSDDLAKFGLPAAAKNDQRREAIERCQRKQTLPITGEYDAATQKAAQEGKCKPGN